MFVLHSLEKRFGGHVVLDAASWQAPHRGVIGLVGPNGAGKTTLLRILAGEEELDGGNISIPGGTTLGYLPQELAESDVVGSVLDTILEGRSELLELEARIETLQEQMTDGDHGVVDEHSLALEQYQNRGGWTFRSNARQIAAGLGFEDDILDRPISTFSGGWQMRAILARLLLQKPDILLLDEPTNHLDTESLEWLEDFLARYEGLIIVVSHDRWFLNRMTVAIVEMQSGKLTEYKGNWDAYREKKAVRIEQMEAAAGRQEREVQRIREFIERFRYQANKAKQVQSRVKTLEKMEKVEVPTEEVRDIQFRFPQPPRTPKIVAEAREITKRYGSLVVWDGMDFNVSRGDKIALMGPNGAGKTTLLKVLAGVLPIDGGEVRIGPGVKIAYFAQHAVESLDPGRTVYDEMMSAADHDTAPRVRTMLGAFGFSGADVDKHVRVLSGGEKNRLALAKMMLEPAGLLLLDEPTNHLDISSRQVLEFALNDYDGSYVIVSHDRYFVNEVAERVVHLEDGQATEYLGDYDYYRWKRDAENERRDGVDESTAAAEADDETGVVSKKDVRRAAAELRKRKKAAIGKLQTELDNLEKRIEELEQTMSAAETQLGDPEVCADEEAMLSWTRQYQDAATELEKAMESWTDLAAEIEEIEQRVEEGAS